MMERRAVDRELTSKRDHISDDDVRAGERPGIRQNCPSVVANGL